MGLFPFNCFLYCKNNSSTLGCRRSHSLTRVHTKKEPSSVTLLTNQRVRTLPEDSGSNCGQEVVDSNFCRERSGAVLTCELTRNTGSGASSVRGADGGKGSFIHGPSAVFSLTFFFSFSLLLIFV